MAHLATHGVEARGREAPYAAVCEDVETQRVGLPVAVLQPGDVRDWLAFADVDRVAADGEGEDVVP